ncbi:MAG: T9SS type A sorting domain-containing protein, partial [Aliifodinibius sp.]|nr:T9SS type A sorting domain-containing protein [Fodinibius sp.]
MKFLNTIILVFAFSILLSSNMDAHVALDYPTGGETFEPNESVTIAWHIVISHGPCTWDLYFSSDGGNTWQTIAAELPKSQQTFSWTVPTVQTQQGRIRVYMDNETGTDYEDQSGDFIITASTGINSSSNQPEKFSLYPAFPNPFNAQTMIAFDLPSVSDVRLEIYNILGGKVEMLVNEQMQAGRHQVRWDASGLPSGIYLY